MAGQASEDFLGGSGRLRILYVGHRNTLMDLTADALTQTNPPIVAIVAQKSATLTGVTKTGVLGSTCAITRPDAGNNEVGGPPTNEALAGNFRPLGLFINDAKGNAHENSPGEASNKVAYVNANGSYGCQLYEDQQLHNGAALSPVWGNGALVYCSRNGLITPMDDANNTLERVAGHGMAPAVGTVVGIVRSAATAALAEVTLDLYL